MTNASKLVSHIRNNPTRNKSESALSYRYSPANNSGYIYSYSEPVAAIDFNTNRVAVVGYSAKMGCSLSTTTSKHISQLYSALCREDCYTTVLFPYTDLPFQPFRRRLSKEEVYSLTQIGLESFANLHGLEL